MKLYPIILPRLTRRQPTAPAKMCIRDRHGIEQGGIHGFSLGNDIALGKSQESVNHLHDQVEKYGRCQQGDVYKRQGKGEGHIFQGIHGIEKVVCLEDESHLFTAEADQLPLRFTALITFSFSTPKGSNITIFISFSSL